MLLASWLAVLIPVAVIFTCLSSSALPCFRLLVVPLLLGLLGLFMLISPAVLTLLFSLALGLPSLLLPSLFLPYLVLGCLSILLCD